MRQNLDKPIKADQYARYVDDIGISVNDTEQLCANIRTVFECIWNTGLKLTMSNSNSESKKLTYWATQLHQTALLRKLTKLKSTYPVIAFNGNRSVTRFFSAKLIPPALWNACDYVFAVQFCHCPCCWIKEYCS